MSLEENAALHKPKHPYPSALCRKSLLLLFSVTRFAEIQPLWQVVKNLWQYILGLFGFGQSFQLTLAQFVCYWAHFHCRKWPNIVNTIRSSGHTASLQLLFLFAHK